MSHASMSAIDAFDQGRMDGLTEAVLADGEPIGEPVGVDEAYLEGWWCGVYEAEAWMAGWDACGTGAPMPLCDRDDEAAGYRALWLAGYVAALAHTEARHA